MTAGPRDQANSNPTAGHEDMANIKTTIIKDVVITLNDDPSLAEFGIFFRYPCLMIMRRIERASRTAALFGRCLSRGLSVL